MHQDKAKDDQVNSADLQDLAIETFEIEELKELDATAALEDISISLCSSTCSSSCG
jgi:hypothetical protein